ncbi:hypothetical protein LTR36_001508, partial [Oleoguttula mirabilis]
DCFFNGAEIKRAMSADRDPFHRCLETLFSRNANDNGLLEIVMDPVVVSHIIAVVNQKLFVSYKGNFGVCPEAVVAGDQLYVLSGCLVPVILRQSAARVDEDAHHKVLANYYA